ncbi:MAG TPA: hypothetical protein VNO14_12260, partial [Blastocatellia bacterium]|nr:hypothetical protein [Blastocatellia bacterium]
MLAWACLGSRFRDAEGYLQGAFCLPLSATVALIVLGYACTKHFRRPALWFALALVGQAVALQMIDAGRLIKYQHYRPFDHPANGASALLLGFLAVQTALVVAGLKRYWPMIREKVCAVLKPWQLACVGAIFFLSSAAVSRSAKYYLFELFFATFVQAVNLANVALIALTLPREAARWLKSKSSRLLGQPVDGDGQERGSIDRFALAAAIWVVALGVSLSLFSYERYPHVPDEVIYLYHARYLADGEVTAPAPPVPEAFSLYMVPYKSDRWYSIFPPGWPAMLAVGLALGIDWLINPLLAGLNVLLAYMLLGDLYSRRFARIAVLLLCISPWHTFMAMNYMSHTFTLTCALAATLGLARARSSGFRLWGLGGGAA